jgi:hypothetical protein
LCEQALDILWTRARNASAAVLNRALLELSATTNVELDEQARPVGVQGTWVGTVEVRDTTVSLGGTTTGATTGHNDG